MYLSEIAASSKPKVSIYSVFEFRILSKRMRNLLWAEREGESGQGEG